MSALKQVIVIRSDLKMRRGKECAQVAHAAMKFLLRSYEGGPVVDVVVNKQERRWLEGNHAKIVLSVDSEDALKDVMARAAAAGLQVYDVIDAGLTEFGGVPTLTCIAIGPDESDKIDKITGDLKLR